MSRVVAISDRRCSWVGGGPGRKRLEVQTRDQGGGGVRGEGCEKRPADGGAVERQAAAHRETESDTGRVGIGLGDVEGRVFVEDRQRDGGREIAGAGFEDRLDEGAVLAALEERARDAHDLGCHGELSCVLFEVPQIHEGQEQAAHHGPVHGADPGRVADRERAVFGVEGREHGHALGEGGGAVAGGWVWHRAAGLTGWVLGRQC